MTQFCWVIFFGTTKMKDLKIRILDDAKVEDVDLWLASGIIRVSRTSLLNSLFEAFHAEIVGKEANFENIADCIQGAVRVGKMKVDKERFGT